MSNTPRQIAENYFQIALAEAGAENAKLKLSEKVVEIEFDAATDKELAYATIFLTEMRQVNDLLHINHAPWDPLAFSRILQQQKLLTDGVPTGKKLRMEKPVQLGNVKVFLEKGRLHLVLKHSCTDIELAMRMERYIYLANGIAEPEQAAQANFEGFKKFTKKPFGTQRGH